MRIQNQKTFAAGLLYVALGAGTSLMSLMYPMGTAARIGPGYFPFWLGVLLACCGLSMVWRARRRQAEQEGLESWDWRSLIWVLGSIVLFGFMLKPFGLVLTVATLVVVSSLASHEFTWRGALTNAVLMVLLNVGAFIWGLGLTIPVWPTL